MSAGQSGALASFGRLETQGGGSVIASMLVSDPDKSWFRIAKVSVIMAARSALNSALLPFSMRRRFPLRVRRSFASIDRTTGSRSAHWLAPPASRGRADFRAAQPDFDPISRHSRPLDNVQVPSLPLSNCDIIQGKKYSAAIKVSNVR